MLNSVTGIHFRDVQKQRNQVDRTLTRSVHMLTSLVITVTLAELTILTLTGTWSCGANATSLGFSENNSPTNRPMTTKLSMLHL